MIALSLLHFCVLKGNVFTYTPSTIIIIIIIIVIIIIIIFTNIG